MNRFTASILAQPEAIAALTEQILSFLHTQHVEARAAHHVALIVEEIVTNIGTHGACRDKPVDVSLTVAPAEVIGEIVDQAAPFDPREAPDPDTDGDAVDRQVGGLGLFLVRRFAQSLEYEHRNGGNYTTFAVTRT
jgi:sigma-B regulation protein RsbU (phosphoserine phosphatase)